MSTAYRFGRRVPLPSTRQILHDLRMMMAADKIKSLEQELRDLTRAGETQQPAIVPAHT